MSADHPAGHIERPEGYEEELAARASILDVQPRPLDSPPDPDQDVREFAELTLKRRALKETLDGDKKRLDQLEARILEHFGDKGLKGLDLAGVGKVSIRKQIWARVKRAGESTTGEEKARAIQALKDAGWDEYVSENFNLNTISALFREHRDTGQELPPQLAEAWEEDTRYTLSVRAAQQRTEETS
jgi:hypothetical protein